MMGSLAPTDATAPPTSGGSGARVLVAQPSEFRQKYNVESFQFRHTLANSPLFAPQRVAQVAERMLGRGDLKKFVARSGKFALADTKFKDMPLQAQLAETIRQMESAQTWLKLTSANTADPDYDALMHQVLAEIEELSGQPVRGLITWVGLTVFMASPNIVTPFHIDHESNFLFQISGSKDVSLHRPDDRDVVPETDVEKFYSGDFEAAHYRPELQTRGTIYRLDPGTVVHHPPLAPHWVKNGDNVSVSVSIGFCMRPIDRVARVYQVNHFLRRLGLRPTPPGRSALRDQLKIAGIGMVSDFHPVTPDDILFSGVNRLRALPRAVKRWMNGKPRTQS